MSKQFADITGVSLRSWGSDQPEISQRFNVRAQGNELGGAAGHALLRMRTIGNGAAAAVALALLACSDPAATEGPPAPMSSAGGGVGGGAAGGAPSGGGSGMLAGDAGGETAAGTSASSGAGGGGSAGGGGGAAGMGDSGGPGDASHGSDGAQMPASADFVCSWVLGITTTGEWYKAGFEQVVDDARWQVTPIEMGHLEKWADPQHEIWQSSIISPCARQSKTPDRVVFNATKYEWTTVAEFLPPYLAVIGNIKTKYPSVKRIDLITYARGPGNVECVGANRSSYSYIKPAQDEAAAMLPAMFPGFVFVAPKWEHRSCSDFGLCPHVSTAANQRLAKTIGDYFLKN